MRKIAALLLCVCLALDSNIVSAAQSSITEENVLLDDVFIDDDGSVTEELEQCESSEYWQVDESQPATSVNSTAQQEQDELSEEINELLRKHQNNGNGYGHDKDSKEPKKVRIKNQKEFSEEVVALTTEDDLDTCSKYTTKRLIVFSDTVEFEIYDAIAVLTYGNMHILSYNTEAECEYAFNELLNDTTISSVEVDSVLETEELVTDGTEMAESNETELKKYLANLTSNKDVRVAILDTGIDCTTVDVSRVIDLGINLSTSGSADSIEDDNGHGTDMASIILGNSNNSVKIMPIKIANADGKATILSAFLGLQQAVANDADVVNISMNAIASGQSAILAAAIDEATAAGISVVVSAGNDSVDTANVTPANVESAVVVSAVDETGLFAQYSNYGESVDYCAYGNGNGSGTSVATANVTGILADGLSKGLDETFLKQYAIDLGDEGKDKYYGYGFIGYNYDHSLEEGDSSSTLKDWKTMTDEELDICLGENSNLSNAMFLQSLSEEDLRLILARDTRLIRDYTYFDFDSYDEVTDTFEEKTEIYYKYLLTIDLTDLDVSATYGTDAFDAAYSCGYIRNRDAGNVIRISGVSQKYGNQINTALTSSNSDFGKPFFTNNNTSKSSSVYIDFDKAARIINDNGDAEWLDMRIYVWTNDAAFPWSIRATSLTAVNLFNAGVQKTTVEFHFYTTGGCGNSAMERTFKGVFKVSDLDDYEGVLFYSGYNKFYRTSGTKLKYVAKGSANSSNANNPFSQNTSTTASYPYFFGTVGSDGVAANDQCVWVQVNSVAGAPFKYQYATRNHSRGSSLYYTGTKLSYVIGSTTIDSLYFVPYGTYKLASTESVSGQKNGYKIDGWYTTSGCTTKAASSGTMGTTEKTVYGKYAKETYSITYSLNGGTVATANPTTYDVETATFTLRNPTKTGYTFAGWTGSNGTTKQTSVSIAKGSYGNKSYTANWTANTNTKYVVNHWQQNLTGNAATHDSTNYTLKDTENKTGTTAANVTPAVKSYAGFTAPSTQTVTIAANGSTVVNYYYTRKSYTVTAAKGTGISSVTGGGTYLYGQSFSTKAVLSTGYSFSKWTISDGTEATGNPQYYAMPAFNLTITAYANPITYTITYNLAGGTVSSANPTSYTVETSTFSLKNPTRVGYTFKGWTGSNGTTPSTAISIAKGSTGNKSYTANWTANKYTVSFNGNGSSSGTMSAQSLVYDTASALSSNAYAKTGYSFAGWNTKSDGTGTTYADKASVKNLTATANGNVTLYAQWKANSYTLTFNANGGSVSPTSKTVTYDSVVGTLPTPTRAHYKFLGWYTATSGGTVVTSNTVWKTAANSTVYARWELVQSVVTFDACGGTASKTTVTYNLGSTYETLPTATRTGYDFQGWYTEKNGKGTRIAESTAVIAKSVTFYAYWTLTPITVSIPRTLVLSPEGNCSFTIGADNSVGIINVTVNSVSMTQNNKDEVKNGSVILSSSALTPEIHTIEGTVDVEDLSAGSWIGTLTVDLTFDANR